MDKASIERVMLDSVGNPDTGLLRDSIPAMAAAVAEALNPKKPQEQRVVKAEETR